MTVLQTEFEFTLPKGYVDGDGTVHRDGVMRLATALDEIAPLRDARVKANEAYLTLLILSRVIVKLGDLPEVNEGVIERLFTADLMYLQELYRRVNEDGGSLGRVVCPSCKTFSYPSRELLETIHYQGDHRRSFVRGEGCPKCHDTGFVGRTGIYEVMVVDREIRELISQGAGPDGIRDCYRRAGGKTLLEQGIRLAEKEQSSLDEVMRVAYFE